MKGTLTERFWAKVDKSAGPDGCWVWTASLHPKGYGKIGIAKGRWQLAHIISWTLANGAVPKGLCVLHRCDNPPCINPTHLFLGTLADNNADMKAKDRHQRGERQWMAKLTDEDVRSIRQMAKDGMTADEIAPKFTVVPRTIKDVIEGDTWRHVT